MLRRAIRYRRLVWLGVLGAGLVLAVVGARVSASHGKTHFPAAGIAAPGFVLPDARNSDQSLATDTFRGRPMVLAFYASWCADCLDELEKLQRAHQAFGDGLAIVAVNVQEAAPRARKALDEAAATFPAALDTDARVARLYGLRGVPGTYFIGADGRLAGWGPGGIDEDTLWFEIEALGLKSPQ